MLTQYIQCVISLFIYLYIILYPSIYIHVCLCYISYEDNVYDISDIICCIYLVYVGILCVYIFMCVYIYVYYIIGTCSQYNRALWNDS